MNEDLNILRKTALLVNKWVNRDDFLIYGGLISDLLLGKMNYGSDIDIAFKYKGENQILDVIKSLYDNDFNIVADRDYYIRNTHYVRLLYAIKDEIFLDIAFMNDPYEVGVLTMDSVFYCNQLGELIDNYGGINALEEKHICLREDAKNENPLYIINRLVCVSAKYDISLRDKETKKIIAEKSLKDICKNNIDKDTLAAFLSRLIKSIIKAKDQKQFIRELIDEDIIGGIFPILHIILDRTLLNGRYNNSSSKEEFIKNTYKEANNRFELEELEKSFSYFRYRTWSNDEFRLAHIYPNRF